MLNWLKYRVKTFDTAALQKASLELGAAAKSSEPDIIIGIRSGGLTVAEYLAPAFPHAKVLPITCRRPSTKIKQKNTWLKPFLSKLPRWLNNCLRVAEHIYLTKPDAKPKAPMVYIPDEAELAAIRGCGGKKFLIVDDSLDSGATMLAVREIVQHAAGKGTIIKTATITVTTRNPRIKPDYYLYRYILCRFPWALDA